MFFFRTLLKAFPPSLKKTFSRVEFVGWLILLAPLALIFSGIFILVIIAIILYLLFIYYVYIPNLKDAYYNLMSDETNFPDGNHTIYPSKGGKSYKKVSIVNGKLHGKYELYYVPHDFQKKKGYKRSLRESGTYKNGEKHGIFNLYYYDGMPFESSRYDNQIKSSTEFKDGLRHGYSKDYFDNGQPSFQSYWEKGVQCGEAITFQRDGKIVRKSNLINGEVKKSTEFYLNGMVRMINKGSNYQFYIWNESLDKSIKKCEFDLSIELGDFKYSGPRAKQKKFNGTWSNYNLNGSIDYELKFSETSGDKAEKTNYDVNGNKESSSFVSCKLISDSILAFHSRFVKDRLIPKNNAKCVYSYNNGIMGPPGINRTYNIEINVITSLEDIIEIEET